jgi:guanine deaminase
MKAPIMTTLIRAQLFHTPGNPFTQPSVLEAVADGAIAFQGRILAVGEFAALRRDYAESPVVDARGMILLPGLVDTHVHYPQLPVVGAMGLRLLEWLTTRTLPHEQAFADAAYARAQARRFLRLLAKNGTTTALVFGAHFAGAMATFFEEASGLGLRITSGLVLGDRQLTPALHTTPERAYQESRALLAAWHGHGRLRYAVTPRFSLSCSEALLEACQALVQETPGLFVTTHLNETVEEVAAVATLFPWAGDYLATYERFGLVGPRSVFAHNLYTGDDTLRRLAAAGSSVAHCPSSNAFLGSGLFPLRRHLAHDLTVALGSDVGAGTGLCLLGEALAAYQGQMLQGYPLTPAQLLYLATRAGAEALKLADEVGDLNPGKSADFVLLRPPAGSTLEAVLQHSPSAEATLGALFTLARQESIAEVYLAGKPLLKDTDLNQSNNSQQEPLGAEENGG